MKRLRGDCKGDMLGLPWELLVICIVMAVSIPSIWIFADMYIEKQVEDELNSELKYLKETIIEIENMGEGNKRVIELDFKDNILARIDYVRVGGNKIPDAYNIRYMIDGDEDVIQLGNNPISNTSGGDMRALYIPDDGATLRIKLSKFEFEGERMIDIGILEE